MNLLYCVIRRVGRSALRPYNAGGRRGRRGRGGVGGAAWAGGVGGAAWAGGVVRRGRGGVLKHAAGCVARRGALKRLLP
jgi:hypothetical protein